MKEKDNTAREFKPLEHRMVPMHEILEKNDIEKTLSDYNINKEQMPKIRVTDPVAVSIKAKVGDVVRITRMSPTAGKAIFYRLVIA